MFPSESLKHVQEMFWEDSGLSDLDSNDEQLMDVHVISVAGRNVYERTTHVGMMCRTTPAHQCVG